MSRCTQISNPGMSCLKFVQDLTAKLTLSLFFATGLFQLLSRNIQTSRQIPGFKCSKTTNLGIFRDLSTAWQRQSVLYCGTIYDPGDAKLYLIGSTTLIYTS